MIFPFESLMDMYREFGLVGAVVIGFFFGFVLERAGFGRATTLAAQFYLTDMTVFKVMFSAIVTAMRIGQGEQIGDGNDCVRHRSVLHSARACGGFADKTRTPAVIGRTRKAINAAS